LTLHPLIELATSREVKHTKGFRKVAEGLSGQILEGHYLAEVENAPKRQAAGKKYFAAHSKFPSERRSGKDSEHLASALMKYATDRGEGLEFPDGTRIDLLDYMLPLATASPDRAQGDADPNKGVGKVHLLGQLADGRLAAVLLKFIASSATRGGTGDTPLRALLEGLAQCAILDANREAIAAELAERGGREISKEAPALVLLGSTRYWELCRKREAQKGAAWIREFERLGRETAETIGVEVLFLGLDLEADPGWEYGDAGPVLVSDPSVEVAWEARAGKLKPKPRPKPRRASADDFPVEADLSREVRSYRINDSYTSGDRIEHATLGMGVVQGSAGIGKIVVLFDEIRKVLIHERAPRG
jgi:hypothetical protein